MARQTVPDQPKEMKGIWKPTAADSKREGEYLRIEPPRAGKEKYGETYVILDPTGQEISLPNHTVLQMKMKTLKTGWYVWISFIGKDNKTMLYNIEYDPEYVRQTKLDEKPAMADYMQSIIDQLVFAHKMYRDGIPVVIFTEVIEAGLRKGRIQEDGAFNRVVEALKAEGMIFEPKPGFYKVVV